MDPLLLRRLWSSSHREGDCWVWHGERTVKGYGRVEWLGKRWRVHRLSYTMCIGPIPEGLVIDHVAERGCQSKACWNPAHLEVVTNRENILRGDGATARNARKTHCPKGHELVEGNLQKLNGARSHYRQCLTCHRAAKAAQKKRRRAEARAAS